MNLVVLLLSLLVGSGVARVFLFGPRGTKGWTAPNYMKEN